MKIYNTLTRTKEDFRPLKKGEVKMYVCGPTVYDEPHIGHARAAYIFEVVRSYFEYKGYQVKFVQNITDIDDKIIARAKEELPQMQIDKATAAIARKYTQSYFEDMDALGIRRATITPYATRHIPQMQAYIMRLLEEDFAYAVEGSVYFNVRKFKDYGQLSQQNLEQMRQTQRIEKDEQKQDALDFALWKRAKEGEPSWVSPWGRGRPGWHIECSVMASIYLGDEFDIHAGGSDLIFPHHENEIAQARCHSGKSFARYWMHNGLLTINQQKMAKSLGNFISVRDFLKENIPQVLKMFFLTAHYRSPIDFNEQKLLEAKRAYERFEIFFTRLSRMLSKEKKVAVRRRKRDLPLHGFKKRFTQAMDNDFNTPEALAALFDLLNFGHKLLDDYREEYRPILAQVQQMLEESFRIFRISFAPAPQELKSRVEIEQLIQRRNALRKKGDFAQADRLRRELEEEGIILEDTKEGTTWRRKV